MLICFLILCYLICYTNITIPGTFREAPVAPEVAEPEPEPEPEPVREPEPDRSTSKLAQMDAA